MNLHGTMPLQIEKWIVQDYAECVFKVRTLFKVCIEALSSYELSSLCVFVLSRLWFYEGDNLVFSIYLNSTVPAENYEPELYFDLKLRYCRVNCARSSWKTLTEYLLVNGELPHVFYLYFSTFGISHTVSLFEYIEVDVLYFDAVRWIVHF